MDSDFFDAEHYVRSLGSVFAKFDKQDSGNFSYGVEIQGRRYFIKTAGRPSDPRPFLDHRARVALLRNAVRVSESCVHPTLPALHQVLESSSGPLLLYEWLEGELLGVPRAQRRDPRSAFQRFRSLPSAKIEECLDAIFDLHKKLSSAGWIAVDFYDGCLIYDFRSGGLGVIDLDNYRQGPFRNDMGRMFGSTRFMAPEEFEFGALIDEQTTVFVMGRTALVFLSDGTPDVSAFHSSRALFEVATRASDPDRSRRYGSITAFCSAWRAARSVSN